MPGPFDGAPATPAPSTAARPRARPAAWCWCCTAARRTASNPSAPAAARSGGCRCCATRSQRDVLAAPVTRCGCCATRGAAGTVVRRAARCRTHAGRWTRSAAAYGDVPVALVGHSMGARIASRVADDPNVRGVVGLAPWFDAGDPVAALAGKDLVVGHGLRDRITSARDSQAFIERAAAVAARAEFYPLGGAGHYLLYRPRRWNRFALRHSLDVLAACARTARTRSSRPVV